MSLLATMARTYGKDRASREKLERIQRKRLRALVDYARRNSPFYGELYGGLGADWTLGDLPPVTKPALMARFDDVVTDRAVTMTRVRDFTKDVDNVGRLLDGKYLVFQTSGSTGHPAVVLYDKGAIDTASAVAAFRTFARQEDFKRFMAHGKKTAGVFADHGFYLAAGMSRYLQLRMPRQQTKITVDVNGPEEEIVKALNDFQPAMLSGYPANLALLADYGGLHIRPDVVITGGERLTDAVRQKLSDRFGCYVQTHYSCTEGGELACECAQGHLHINEDWVILEAVDREGKPVAPGVQSDRVFITNLSNFIQPFIRYELTDRVVVHEEGCPCGRTTRWLEVEGRTDDILTFSGGVRVAPMSLYKVLEEVPALRRFQLVQRGEDAVELRLLADDPAAAFAAGKGALETFFESKGLQVAVLPSKTPPSPDPVSGKFRHVFRAAE